MIDQLKLIARVLRRPGAALKPDETQLLIRAVDALVKLEELGARYPGRRWILQAQISGIYLANLSAEGHQSIIEAVEALEEQK